MSEHVLYAIKSGGGMDSSITPICSCGWRGRSEYASNDWQWENVREQWARHLREQRPIIIQPERPS